jgi:hypothetical protein
MRSVLTMLMLLPALAPWTPALAGDSPAARRGSADAAERVQEGNVQQWIEYYERERLKSSGGEPRQSAAPPLAASPADKPPAKP